MDAAWKPLGLKVHAMLDQGMTKIHHQICVSAVMVMDFSKIGWLDTKAFFSILSSAILLPREKQYEL